MYVNERKTDTEDIHVMKYLVQCNDHNIPQLESLLHLT